MIGVAAVLVAAVLLGKGTLFQGSFKKLSNEGFVSGGPRPPAPVNVTRAQCERIAAQITASWARGTDIPNNFDWNAYNACWRSFSQVMMSYDDEGNRVLAEVRRCGEIRRLQESAQLPPGRNQEALLCRTSQPQVWDAPSYAQCQQARRLQAQGVPTRRIPGWNWRTAGACYRVYGL